ncbi:hypothetical protein [Desulfoluna sp.]|uniref:hypothetical protein n=1 Tax=Desulfoluna sp. TaxID=2045199 RepID=UPI00260E8D5B|nr:hypothetical protein [Desulfoluna sp.]
MESKAITPYWLFLLGVFFFGVACVGSPWHRQAGEYEVVQPAPGETLESVAESFGGGAAGLRTIESLNPRALTPGNTPLLVPSKPVYELGIRPDGYPVVPVLSYRWGPEAGTGPSLARVQADLLQLEASGCTLLSPSDFLAFIRMERSIPEQSVLLAFEVSRAEAFRALVSSLSTPGLTGLLFVDPAGVGEEGALTWEEVRRLSGEGIEPALLPPTETGLSAPVGEESLVGYARRVKDVISTSHALLVQQAKMPVRFAAYPDNQGNSVMASVMVSLGIQWIFIQGTGGNPFFCDPLSVVRMDVGRRGAEVPLSRYLDTFRRADLSW